MHSTSASRENPSSSDRAAMASPAVATQAMHPVHQVLEQIGVELRHRIEPGQERPAASYFAAVRRRSTCLPGVGSTTAVKASRQRALAGSETSRYRQGIGKVSEQILHAVAGLHPLRALLSDAQDPVAHAELFRAVGPRLNAQYQSRLVWPLQPVLPDPCLILGPPARRYTRLDRDRFDMKASHRLSPEKVHDLLGAEAQRAVAEQPGYSSRRGVSASAAARHSWRPDGP